jgi:hypothetical protein
MRKLLLCLELDVSFLQYVPMYDGLQEHINMSQSYVEHYCWISVIQFP